MGRRTRSLVSCGREHGIDLHEVAASAQTEQALDHQPQGESRTGGVDAPAALERHLAGRTARVTYAVGPEGVGVRRVTGAPGDLDLTDLTNPHRRPGASVRTDDLRVALDADPDLTVETF